MTIVCTGVALSLSAASTADGGPITCATGLNGATFAARVDPAVSCTGTGVFGQASRGHDNADTLNNLGTYGTGWELLLVRLAGTHGSASGSFVLDPAAFAQLCQGGPCTEFVVAVNWEGFVSYFALGALTTALNVDWAVTSFAVTHINVYGRLTNGAAPVPVPEPGTLVLLGTGLLVAASAARRRMARRTGNPAP